MNFLPSHAVEKGHFKEKRIFFSKTPKDGFGRTSLEQELNLTEVAFASESRHKFVPDYYHFKK